MSGLTGYDQWKTASPYDDDHEEPENYRSIYRMVFKFDNPARFYKPYPDPKKGAPDLLKQKRRRQWWRLQIH